MSNVALAEILSGAVLAWGLGLAPALIARYYWVKAPLQRSSANWIAGVTCAIFWITFRVLNEAAEAEETTPVKGLVWLVIFFVSRWIMTREPKKSLNDSADLPRKFNAGEQMIETTQAGATVSDTSSLNKEHRAERLEKQAAPSQQIAIRIVFIGAAGFIIFSLMGEEIGAFIEYEASFSEIFEYIGEPLPRVIFALIALFGGYLFFSQYMTRNDVD